MIIVAGLLASQGAVAAPQTVRVSVVGDGPWDRGFGILATFEEEIRGLLAGEFDVQFPPNKRLIADFTREGTEKALQFALEDPEVDIVLAVGLIASSLAATTDPLPKPVIATYVIDGPLQGAPMTAKGTSGRSNLSYIHTPDALGRDLEMFHELVGFEKLALLAPQSLLDSVPGATASAGRFGPKLGFETVIIGVGASVDAAIAAIPADVQAVYIAPLVQTDEEQFDKLVAAINARKLPTFSFWGRPEVERGVMAAGTLEPDTRRRARRIALNMQRILLKEDAGTFNVNFPRGEALLINMATSRAIGFAPKWKLMTDAELINVERTGSGEVLSLRSVLEGVVKTNLELAVDAEAFAAQRTEVERAMSSLLPQLEVNGRGTIVDADRAAASFGSAPERSLWVGGKLTQVIYAERAWANVAIQEKLVDARGAERQSLILDLSLAGAEAYFNVLRAKTFERISRENLKKTRANLEMAHIRGKIGVAGPSEVLRWRSQIANDRKSVLQAVAQRNVAEIALNQLLHRGLEDHFQLADVETKEVFDRISPLTLSLDNPRSFRAYREFMVGYGLRQAPELMQLKSAMAGIERNLDSLNRQYWLPSLAFVAQLDHRLAQGGAGTEGLKLEFPPPVVAPTFPEADATNWSMTLALSFPLFSGFAREADISKAEHELTQRSLQEQLVAERIEQRIRSTLHIAGASLPGLELSEDARAAAAENLEVVTDAYARGAVDILTLLDAQNAAFLTEQVAASATYDHLIDLMRVARAVGCFDFLYDQAAFEEFRSSFVSYFEQQERK